jgi:Cdc6-like AAA superfamily ATPase
LIANSENWKEKCGGAVLSRLMGYGINVYFPRYDCYDLEKILEQKIKDALYPDTTTLEQIAEMALYIFQKFDARSLLNILSLAAHNAERFEREKITQEDIEYAKRSLDKENTADILRKLNNNERILLWLIAKSQEMGTCNSSEELISKYLKEAKDDDNNKPLSQASIYRVLSEFETQGIARKEPAQYVRKVGRKPHIWKTFWGVQELEKYWSKENKQ